MRSTPSVSRRWENPPSTKPGAIQSVSHSWFGASAQTNGKIERFHRTLADGWAYSKHYNSESARRAALPAWLHFYNHHRPHTAIGKLPPISRISNNLTGHYN